MLQVDFSGRTCWRFRRRRVCARDACPCFPADREGGGNRCVINLAVNRSLICEKDRRAPATIVRRRSAQAVRHVGADRVRRREDGAEGDRGPEDGAEDGQSDADEEGEEVGRGAEREMRRAQRRYAPGPDRAPFRLPGCPAVARAPRGPDHQATAPIGLPQLP
jgi:hypothetical protein